MKRTLQATLLSFLLVSAVAAQDAARTEKTSSKTVNMTGVVGSEGKTLVTDKGSRVWKVVNSDLLVATQGHHVAVRARINADASEIFVSIVRLQEVRTTAKLDDVAFRR